MFTLHFWNSCNLEKKLKEAIYTISSLNGFPLGPNANFHYDKNFKSFATVALSQSDIK